MERGPECSLMQLIKHWKDVKQTLSSGTHVNTKYKGCTSGGVYVPCIYTPYVWWKLPFVAQVFGIVRVTAFKQQG